MDFKDKRHSLTLFIGIFILSALIIWQGNISPFTLSRSDDDIDIISDRGVRSEEISTGTTRASFNYRQELNVPFRWEEPLQGAAKIQFTSSDYVTVPLGFNFPFYDGSYSSINLFTHGYASFTSTYSTSSNVEFPSNDGRFAKIIAPLWDYVYYWNPGPIAGIYHKSLQNPERYLVTWYQAPYEWGGGTCTFQMVLYKDNGNILINYQRVTQNMRPTGGLNDGDGVHYNMPFWNNQRPGNSQSIVFGTIENDVAMDQVQGPEPGTRVLPGRDIHINATVINYGFNARNNVPVELTITCDEEPGYLHTNSTVTSGNQGVMESRPISFKWAVPGQENRHYTLKLETVLSSPPDEVQAGNELEFRITGKTFYDIGVWEVKRVKGEWYPYQDIPVTAKIANWGNIDTNCSVKMTVNGKHQRFKDAPVLGSGGIEGVVESLIFNISFTWMVTSPGKYTIGITTVLDNDEVAGNNIKSVVKEIVVSPFDVRLAYNGSTLSGKPNSVVSFKLTVYNDGEKKDDIQLNVTEYPSEKGWSIPVFDHNILRSMGRETSRGVSLIVAIPPLAAAGLATVRLKAHSLSDGNTNVTLGLLVNVLPDPKVSVMAPQGMSHYPGKTIRYNFTIKNTGNSADSFSIMTSSSNNWNSKVIGSAITDVLFPNSDQDNQTIQVTATVPDNSLYGSTDILTVTAASLEDINVQSSSHVSTTVLQYHDVKIKAAISEYAVHTERDVWISFNVTNTGNGKDETISFAVDTPYGWHTYIDDSKLHGGLERLYWAQILMKIRVPRGTANDVFPLSVAVLAEDPPVEKDTFTFYFEILPEFGINISATEPLKVSPSEKNVTYRLEVKNTGNTYEAFTVFAESKWLSFIYDGSPGDVWLKGNETRSVEVVVNMPPGTEADSDNSTREINHHTFMVEVASSSNPKAIRDSTKIHLSVVPHHDHILFGGFGPLKVARKLKDQSIDYQLYVQNTGNVQDIIHLKMNGSVYGPLSASVSPINVHLSHGETKAVVLTLKVRPDAALGTYHLAIDTTSGGNGSFEKQLTLTVDVVDYDFRTRALSIDGIEISSANTPRLKRNHPISVGVIVENLGEDRFEGVYGNNLTIAFYLGTTPIYSRKIGSLDKGEIKKISFEWKPKVIGKRELVVVVNDYDGIPESVTDNNEIRAEIEVLTDIHSLGDEKGKENAPEFLFYLGIILIILLSGIIVFSLLFLLRKRNLMEGYDEDGEYRPDIYQGRLERKEIGIDLDEWGDMYSESNEETETRSEGYFVGKGKGLTPPIVKNKEKEGRGPDLPSLPTVTTVPVTRVLPVHSDESPTYEPNHGKIPVHIPDNDIKSLPPAGTDIKTDEHSEKRRTIITKPVLVPFLKTAEKTPDASVTMKKVTTKPVGMKGDILPKAITIPVNKTTTGLPLIKSKPLSAKPNLPPDDDKAAADTGDEKPPAKTLTASVRVITKPVSTSDTLMTIPVLTSEPVVGNNIEESTSHTVQKKTGSGIIPIPGAVVTKPVPESSKGKNPEEATIPSLSTKSEDTETVPTENVPENSKPINSTETIPDKISSEEDEEIGDEIDELLRGVEDLEL